MEEEDATHPPIQHINIMIIMLVVVVMTLL
jgi:hypothetical protein